MPTHFNGFRVQPVEPLPVPPETITRGPDGNVTVRAVRLDEPLALDGALDEAVYERVRPASGFIQIEPNPGAQARDQTEIWIMFDNDNENVYVAARAWDSDMEIITTEMRRDNLWNGDDIIGFSFDTFLDRRNSLSFDANALGARHDGQSTNESQWNGDLNPIWEVATGRFDGGWTLEAVIPFKSLRYGPGRQQTWGLQVLPGVRAKRGRACGALRREFAVRPWRTGPARRGRPVCGHNWRGPVLNRGEWGSCLYPRKPR